MIESMPRKQTRPLVSADDDPLFSADHAHCPSGAARRASITVGEVAEIARRAAEAEVTA